MEVQSPSTHRLSFLVFQSRTLDPCFSKKVPKSSNLTERLIVKVMLHSAELFCSSILLRVPIAVSATCESNLF